MVNNLSDYPDCKLLNEKGLAFYLNQEYTEALLTFKKVAAIVPYSATIWNNIGNTLSALKRQSEALAAYERATILDPQFHAAYFNKGLLLAEMGAYGNALESYAKAISICADPLYIHAQSKIWLKNQLFPVFKK
ncbi:tetratricopeptide repeat protein [Gloeothece verrucosa]|uniref:TPR repeat-containing protein n=1 Tax=Gloeothece verrucosa (strain PCC 7822) TaxID=497965 RepID=E0ULI7_GLOV7|nr:tetratricopeptide repeat protein [Gloeothece verrucosa]ADN17817.1 TPR repeat-containing protein [Gloeothece verrucosa PCC 7822]